VEGEIQRCQLQKEHEKKGKGIWNENQGYIQVINSTLVLSYADPIDVLHNLWGF
jgi:hypothetical protein